MPQTIVLHVSVTDEVGNQFPADLGIDVVELKGHLEKIGYTLVKKK